MTGQHELERSEWLPQMPHLNLDNIFMLLTLCEQGLEVHQFFCLSVVRKESKVMDSPAFHSNNVLANFTRQNMRKF